MPPAEEPMTTSCESATECVATIPHFRVPRDETDLDTEREMTVASGFPSSWTQFP
jgi:hypothetical protein